MNRIKILSLAAVCALTMASCGEKDSGSEAATPQTDPAVSSQSPEVSETESKENDTPTSLPDDSSNTDDASSKADDAAVYDPGLIKLAKEMYDAKVITGTYPDILFDDELEHEGAMALCAEIKTVDIFDPFDDMLTEIVELSKVMPDAQILLTTQCVELETGMTADGLLMAVAFGCEDEAKAKKVFSYVFTEDMKNDIAPEDGEDDDHISSYFSEDGDTILIALGNNELLMCYGYYRIGSNIYVVGIYDSEFTDTPLNGEYRKVYDYTKELEDICKKLGVRSPAELRK